MMSTITIDDREYVLETLSDEVKNNLQMLALTDQELQRLQAHMAMVQTARMAYARAVQTNLPDTEEQDTIRFN